MFGNLFKGKAKAAIQQMSGNKDFLEGMCAGCALTAAAGDGIDDAEYDKTLLVIKSNSAISAGFGSGEIEQVFGRMAPKTATRSGRAELMEEIRQVVERDKTGNMGTAICLAALDVADEGGISEAEEKTLKSIAELCGVNYAKLVA
jgi:tellurite resistance protein